MGISAKALYIELALISRCLCVAWRVGPGRMSDLGRHRPRLSTRSVSPWAFLASVCWGRGCKKEGCDGDLSHSTDG